jgi:hypothetical protein
MDKYSSGSIESSIVRSHEPHNRDNCHIDVRDRPPGNAGLIQLYRPSSGEQCRPSEFVTAEQRGTTRRSSR